MTAGIVRRAFVASLPVLTGYLSMGTAWGVLLTTQIPASGVADAAAISACTISGSMQFSGVGIVRNAAQYSVWTVVFFAVLINIRYAAYGLPFIEEFKRFPRWLRGYLAFALTDETYALQLQCPYREDADRRRYLFWVAAFDQFYWIAGGALGAAAGKKISFNATGIDFAMAALFIVILVEQCKEKEKRFPAWIGGGVTAATWGVFSLCAPGHADKMLFPALALIVALLLFMRKKGRTLQ